MAAVGLERELSLQERRTSGGVDHPTGGRRGVIAEVCECDPVITAVSAQSDLAHSAALCHLDTERSSASRQLVFEQPSVDLVVIVRRKCVWPELDALGDISIPVA